MTVPKREDILLSNFISSLCSLLQVAIIFTVTSYSALMKVSLLAMGVCRISYEDVYFSLCFYFLFPNFCLCPDLCQSSIGSMADPIFLSFLRYVFSSLFIRKGLLTFSESEFEFAAM